MFATMPGSEVRLPPEFGDRPGSRWRLVEQTGAGFFLAVMSMPKDAPDGRRAVMVCWDSDVVHLIEGPTNRATFLSLHYVSTTAGVGGDEVVMREVREIWRGVDQAAGNCEVIIFVAIDGSAFCGEHAIAMPDSVKRVSLVTEVRRTSPGNESPARKCGG